MGSNKKLGCEGLAIMIVVLGVLGVCLPGGVQYHRSRRAAAPLEAFKEQARAACTKCFSLSTKSEGAPTPYRRGGVLVVEGDTGEVTAIIGLAMADLPVEIRAATPEEVSTIVCAGAAQ